MIRWLLIGVLVLALGAATAYFLRPETGYVLVSFHGWIVETSVLGLALTLVVGMLGVWLLLRFIGGSVRMPGAVRTALDRRRHDRAQASFESGLLHLLEGNWKRAEIELVRRAADHHAAHLNYLAAARAAQRLGAAERRDRYLDLAMSLAPELQRATLLTQAELQLERGEAVSARHTLERLRAKDAKHPYAMALQAESLFRIGEWEALRVLLSNDTAAQVLAPVRRREMLERCLIERMTGAEQEARLDQLKALWDATPREARQWPAVRAHYAGGLIRLNAQADALAVATETLNREWDAALATVYGEAMSGDALGQLASIEQWLSRYGERPELLIAAGRACLRNRLWGKARSYLEAVIRDTPSASAYLALAQICEATQKPDEAVAFYRQGLQALAAPVPAQPALPQPTPGQVSKA
jgi:HemY protein